MLTPMQQTLSMTICDFGYSSKDTYTTTRPRRFQQQVYNKKIQKRKEAQEATSAAFLPESAQTSTNRKSSFDSNDSLTTTFVGSTLDSSKLESDKEEEDYSVKSKSFLSRLVKSKK